jgi:hypothetical protein
MKDAKGHGSDSHGGDVGAKLYSLMKPPSMIPGYPRADAAHQAGVRSLPDDPDALVQRLRSGIKPEGYADRVSRAPGFLERMGRASKRGFSPV